MYEFQHGFFIYLKKNLNINVFVYVGRESNLPQAQNRQRPPQCVRVCVCWSAHVFPVPISPSSSSAHKRCVTGVTSPHT